MLTWFELPPTVHHHHRVWQHGGYDMNTWSEKKRLEKLNYMHANPVKRGLVSQPEDWPWSSWRFYCLERSSILTMDRMPLEPIRGWQRHKKRCRRHPRNPLPYPAPA